MIWINRLQMLYATWKANLSLGRWLLLRLPRSMKIDANTSMMARYVWMLVPLLPRIQQAIVLIETVLLSNVDLMWIILRYWRTLPKQLISSLMTTLLLLPNRTRYALWALLSLWCNKETYPMRSKARISNVSIGSSQSLVIPSFSKFQLILFFSDGSLVKPDFFLRIQNNCSHERKAGDCNISPYKAVTNN